MKEKHYALRTERSESETWYATLKDLDESVDGGRVWIGTGGTELEAITQALLKAFEAGATSQ
jgi:hypothetical protein